MPAVSSVLSDAIVAAFHAIEVEPPQTMTLEVPARREHGDWSSNAAMLASKAVGRNPRELASALVEYLNTNKPQHVLGVEIAGPGFVNFRLADSWLHDVVRDVVAEGRENYGKVDVGGGTSVIVEYVSANPTGPLHAGHARWASFGDALSRVLARANFAVHREFYVNDRGVQVQHYADSLKARRDGLDLPENGYAGQYIIDWAAEMPADADALEWGLAKSHQYQSDTMKRMNVEFDTWSSERAIAARGDVEAALSELTKRGATYVAVHPENTNDRTDDDAPKTEGGDPATWLRTTSQINPKSKKSFDDADRVLVKGDGTYTYFMPDIAYHFDKFSRADLLIDILGADHHGYVGRMKAAMMCLGHDPSDVEILIGQNCVLLRNGEEVKMSKRTGDFIELAEIIDEVGPDVAKLTFLLQSIDTRQTVDLGVITSSKLDNPVHYIHYAHARIHGIGRKAGDLGLERWPIGDVDLSLLADEAELEVLRSLSGLPAVVRQAAIDRAPHKVTTWLRELAGTFQYFYGKCSVLGDTVDEPRRQARFWLVEATRIGLSAGLDLLGVSAPERMDDLNESELTPHVEGSAN